MERILTALTFMIEEVLDTASHGDEAGQGANSSTVLLVLVQRAQQGDEGAFEEIYGMFAKDLYRYTASRIPEYHASDLVSEIFFRVWKKLPLFTGEADNQFRAWVFTIAHHLVIDFYRTHRDVQSMDDTFEIVDEELWSNPTHSLAITQDFDRTREALEKLPPKQREALILRYINDIGLPDIAEIMGEKEGNVRILIHRGLKRLRELLTSA